ncbi:hypothetical protein RRG08_008856 [Elysia crispata]|uniref:Uncharacterized protein n=1 Tax=Elysia crispata TaxID=231223 RepID=A0AAE1A936_9GAST|nr:hypothetical protein RRG08_008856 [Elysia crispata]
MPVHESDKHDQWPTEDLSGEPTIGIQSSMRLKETARMAKELMEATTKRVTRAVYVSFAERSDVRRHLYFSCGENIPWNRKKI